MQAKEKGWQAVSATMKVVRLTWAVGAMVPALFLSALSTGTRAVSCEEGKFGFAVGAIITGGSLIAGWALCAVAGIAGPALVLWALGGSGLVMMASAVKPTAFVKSICTRCRLLPVIKEHEAIHMAGVDRDNEVWASMKTRHSCQSLGLTGDPAICSFCPIPKRLKEG